MYFSSFLIAFSMNFERLRVVTFECSACRTAKEEGHVTIQEFESRLSHLSGTARDNHTLRLASLVHSRGQSSFYT